MTPPDATPFSFDWHQPWGWPVGAQRAVRGVTVLLGCVCLSPWWLTSWQAWTDAQVRAQTLAQQQEDTRVHRQRTAQVTQQLTQETAFLTQALGGAGQSEAVVRALMASARAQHLQVPKLSLDPAIQTAASHTLPAHHLPLSLELQGAGAAWLKWLAQWPVVAPGVTVSSLDLKALPAGHVWVQLKLLLPQALEPTQSPWLLAGAGAMAAPRDEQTDPFNADDWARLQRQHAQQHPSFATWVAPEQHRSPEPLEAFSRERLRYVGWLSQGGVSQALVRVGDEASGHTQLAPPLGDTVYRVGVGGYLGQDMGRVFTVTPEQLSVRELVRHPDGTWSPRHVVLPLEGGDDEVFQTATL